MTKYTALAAIEMIISCGLLSLLVVAVIRVAWSIVG